MNGNIYVQLPCSNRNITAPLLQKLREDIAESVKPYFCFLLDIVFVDAPSFDNVEVFVMDKPKYSGHDDDIKKQIAFILTSNLPELTPQMVNVRINYSQFNPNFQPTEYCADSVKKAACVQADDCKRKPSMENNSKRAKQGSGEFDYDKLSENYYAVAPRYSFQQVILPAKTLEQIEHAIGILEVESKVFDEWGLRSIIPTASSALSFYGPPGTGKSMAAEAIAQKLGKNILSATYADIESKFHGEGPKMVKAIFKAAERDNAVLFLDESDSLLSKRLTNVSDGSAQAINSMRSQLLISLEQFKGIVIFATNLVVNYDKAFLSRLINVEFTMPTENERERIWWQHLKTDKIHVPLACDVDVASLAAQYEFCGREIKSAVKSACIATALEKREQVTQSDFIKACDITREESQKVISASDHSDSKSSTLTDKQKKSLITPVQQRLDSNLNVQHL